jgi:hypothetical protein
MFHQNINRFNPASPRLLFRHLLRPSFLMLITGRVFPPALCRQVAKEALSQGAVPYRRASYQRHHDEGSQQRQEGADPLFSHSFTFFCFRFSHIQSIPPRAPSFISFKSSLLPQLMAVRIVQHAFDIIHLLTDENPIQVHFVTVS